MGKETQRNVAHEDRNNAGERVHGPNTGTKPKPVHQSGHARAVLQVHEQQHEVVVPEQPGTHHRRKAQRQEKA